MDDTCRSIGMDDTCRSIDMDDTCRSIDMAAQISLACANEQTPFTNGSTHCCLLVD